MSDAVGSAARPTKRQRRRRAQRLAATLPTGIATAVGLFAVNAAPASAGVNFWRQGATDRANLSWNSDPGAPFGPFPNDCTNFLSLSWHLGGGVPMNPQWEIVSDWTAPPHFREWTASWTVVETFEIYHRTEHWNNGSLFTSRRATNLDSGLAGSVQSDGILYNWNDGGSQTDHLSIETGALVFSNVNGWTDPTNGHKYNISGTYTVINQHTTNRQWAPWNLGYLQEKYRFGDAAQANGMLFKVVHVNT